MNFFVLSNWKKREKQMVSSTSGKINNLLKTISNLLESIFTDSTVYIYGYGNALVDYSIGVMEVRLRVYVFGFFCMTKCWI